MSKPKMLVFASGTKDGGGSGFENLVKSPDLDAQILAVVSNHESGGVRERAERLSIPFIYFPGPYDAEHYRAIAENTGAEWFALSGWMRKIEGLDPRRTFNIHPALLSFDHGRFGGKGMYGHRIHDAVKAAFDAGEITDSGFSMHFVTDEYDRGPTFFEYKVPLEQGMTIDDIQRKINIAEHQWQPKVTNMVVHGEIRWEGKDPASLIVPKTLEIH